jgi:hypothetical protein
MNLYSGLAASPIFNLFQLQSTKADRFHARDSGEEESMPERQKEGPF